jgi:hypothetical protein
MSRARPGLTHIQVSILTRDRLRAFLARMIEEQERGTRDDLDIHPEPINPASLGVSMDWLINYLIDAMDSHRRRARESRERAKAKRKES